MLIALVDLIEVEPFAVSELKGHASGGEVVGSVYMEYPLGAELRALRVKLELSPREAAAALGLLPEKLSGIELGRYHFKDGAQWTRAKALLKEQKNKLLFGSTSS